MVKAVATFGIQIDGYEPSYYVARKPGQARARAYREFTEMYSCTFREFLIMSSYHRVQNESPVGHRILVHGKSATHCGFRGMYVQFMFDDDDILRNSHQDDVFLSPS